MASSTSSKCDSLYSQMYLEDSSPDIFRLNQSYLRASFYSCYTVFPSQIPFFSVHISHQSTAEYCRRKGKAIPVRANYSSLGFQQFEAPRYQDSRHMKVVRLSAPRTGRLYQTRKYPWYSFLLEAVSTPGT